MFKEILRGLASASVAISLLAFVAGCSNMQGSSGAGRDTTGTGGMYGGGTQGGTTTGGDQAGMLGGSTGTATTTTGSDQEMQGGQGSAGDATALAKLKSADSSEVALSQYALDRLSDSKVKEFAQMLIDDHQKDLDRVNSLASEQSITPMPPSNDSTEQHLDNAMSMLKSADKGQSFDQAFLQMQISDHQSTISSLQALQSLASNSDIKSHINDVLPKLQKHLDQAQDLMKNLGMSQTGR
jgi:putative membrane protein